MGKMLETLRKAINRGNLFKLLVVIVIISIIMTGMPLPVLSEAGAKEGYARWVEYRDKLRTHPNLVAYYDFEEGEGNTLKNQAAGQGQTGYVPEKLNGKIFNPTRWTTGRWSGKGALNFDGKADYVDCGHESLQNLPTLTVEAWVKPASLTGYANVVVKWDNSKGAWILRASQNSDGRFIPHVYADIWFTPVGGWYAVSGSEVPLNEWSHLVMTYDGETLRGYQNGVETCNEPDPSGSLPPLAVPVHIGGTGADRFNGIIDEVAIYNRALTEEEIQEHYKMGKPDNQPIKSK